jgi:hypothetical protein
LVVVVVEGLLEDVVVEGGAVVVDAAVVDVVEAGTLDVTDGAVVGVALGVVVVVMGWLPPASTCSSAVSVDVGGLGSDTLCGTNPTVISWRSANLRSAG